MRFGFTSASAGAGLAVSILAHVLLLGAAAVPLKRQIVRGETVSVDLVSPEEAAAAFADQESAGETEQQAPQQQESPKEETQPDWSQLQLKDPTLNPEQSQTSGEAAKQQQPRRPHRQAAQQQPQQLPQSQQQPPHQQTQPQQAQPQQQAAVQPQPQEPPPQQPPQQQPPQQPAPSEQQVQPPAPAGAAQLPPENPAEQHVRLATMLGLPIPGEASNPYGTEAETKANLSSAEIAAFKSHLKKCWTLPPGYSESQSMKVIVRAVLKQDGRLASEPEAIEVSPAKLGGPIFLNARKALKQCQPFNMLPPEKYKEWRVIDLNFSPDQMAGG